MWFLSFIPDTWLQWFIHGVVMLGFVLFVLGWFANKIPFISSYGGVAKSIGILVLLGGIYFEGGYGTEMMWRAKVNDLQEKVKESEKKSAEANDKLKDALASKSVIIKEKVNENRNAIESNRSVIESDCKLNDTAWLLYNRAVEPKVSGSTGSSN